ncbi:9807_t:CDS:2 [Acaulospora colombiana]|uniref:9807_t:CDS:1 n=1 Tax=Acaulospora colombiana TaxID=27376 RepID=A0ACA9KGR9_9GLOM|nr:9807_t:CDS:2 [Acaulospora colombiana]
MAKVKFSGSSVHESAATTTAQAIATAKTPNLSPRQFRATPATSVTSDEICAQLSAVRSKRFFHEGTSSRKTYKGTYLSISASHSVVQFTTQYKDSRVNPSSWDNAPQVNETHLTHMINRTYEVLDVLFGIRNEISSRTAENAPVDVGEIILSRKPRAINVSQPRTKYRKRNKRAAPPGRCHSCNISETPEWRRGPDGARTLCNACDFAKITRKRALSAMQQFGPHSVANTTMIYNNTTKLITMPTPQDQSKWPQADLPENESFSKNK